MRVALDATPLLGTPTGVGRYVSGLVTGLAETSTPPEVRLAAFTWRGAKDVPPLAGARVVGRRAPARLLQALWTRSNLPPAEYLTGSVDLVHGTNFVLPPRRRAAGVVTVHDLAYLHDANTVTPATLRYQRLVPRAIAAGALVLTPSQASKDAVLEAYRIDGERVRVTPLGVDEEWFSVEPPEPAWLEAQGLPTRYIVAVGNLEPRKNLPHLVEAHRRLRCQLPDAPPLVLAGPPGWGEPLAAGPDVVFAGYRRGAALRRIVAGAAVLAFPSRREGFGLPPLEAFAAGVPVVASDLAVTREVLGDAATFVPVGDVDALVAALAEALAADPNDDAARAARRDRARRFTWLRCAETTLAAYEAALS